jgi:hypothetical protein
VRHLEIDGERSTVIVEARSSVGPIAWEGVGPRGRVALADDGARVVTAPRPSGWLELPLDALRSGNRVYDAELLRRVDARRHPVARIDLEDAVVADAPGRYHATGRLAFHGTTLPVSGELEVDLRPDGTLHVTGSQQVDIRDFGLPAPTLLMLKVYPDVRVHLVVEAAPVDA